MATVIDEEAMQNSSDSSGDEDIVVHKKKNIHSATQRLIDSDDESNINSAPVASSNALTVVTHDSGITESPYSCDEQTANHVLDTEEGFATKRNKHAKKRIIRALSESDDEQSKSVYFANTASTKCGSNRLNKSSESYSGDEIKQKSTRIRRRDKMVDNIKKRFEKKGKNTNKLVETGHSDDGGSDSDKSDCEIKLKYPKNEKKGKYKEINLENLNVIKPLASLCDKDTSSDSEVEQSLKYDDLLKSSPDLPHKQVNGRTTKYIEELPKPKRMSAKEAMENMTKIKSESNRMLRERRVLLPYHRPRQLSLKDILSRKKPATDLPLRMNQEQLKLYAHQLEESQKEMVELYKSDEEEDNSEEEGNDEVDQSNQTNNDIDKNPFPNDDSVSEITHHRSECNSDVHDVDVGESDTTKKDENKNNSAEENTSSEIALLEKPNKTVVNALDNTDKNDEDDSEIFPVEKDHTEKAKIFNSTQQTNTDSQSIHLHLDSENTEVDTTYSVVGLINENLDIHSLNGGKITVNDSSCKKKCESSMDDMVEVDKNKQNSEFNESNYKALENNKKINNEEFILKSSNNDCSLEGNNKKIKENATDFLQDCEFNDNFSDDDNEMAHIEALMDKIENGKEITMEDSPMLIKDVKSMKPHLSGAPGMVIDLDAPTTSAAHRQSGVELLKQRYMFFSKMRTPEEEEREKERKMKPGTKHQLLKHELEKQITEQSIAEWTKRLEEEKQQQQEIKEINGELSDCEAELDEVEKESKKEKEVLVDAVECEMEKGGYSMVEDGDEEEEEIEDEKDKSTKSKPNLFIDDEAEVDDDEDKGECDSGTADEEAADDEENESSEEESSSEEEDAVDKKPKKGRIIKAFEDSDDEDLNIINEIEPQIKVQISNVEESSLIKKHTSDLFDSQNTDADEEISLAQPNQTNSEEMNLSFNEETVQKKLVAPISLHMNSQKLQVLFETQPNTEVDMEAIVGMCSGKFPTASQADLPPVPASIARLTDGAASTQVIGEDILQLCSGKFEEHLLETQTLDNEKLVNSLNKDEYPTKDIATTNQENRAKRLFDDLDDTEWDLPKSDRFFGPNINANNSISKSHPASKESKPLQKGKLVIESSDEETGVTAVPKKKKLKRKKLDQRALVISDDEDEESERELSELEEEELLDEDAEERLVEYDSEENEVVTTTTTTAAAARRRAAVDLLEREAELSSEEEWAGSGDEDERGLDRMEREAGDDDVFHEGQLRRELGQMHMQDVLDQDKREVRLLQEILLEDGDLTGGGRQRRFRWRDVEGAEEAAGAAAGGADEFADTPEEERECEERWRRQRHERQLFLRQLAAEQKDDGDILGLELVQSSVKVTSAGRESSAPGDTGRNHSAKDLPSPVKNAFTIMQAQYRAVVSGDAGGALRRLAAAAAAAPEDRPRGKVGPARAGSFVFATLAHPSTAATASTDAADVEPDDDLDRAPVVKKTKRKAESASGTPKLIKKLRLEEQPRKSILHRLDL